MKSSLQGIILELLADPNVNKKLGRHYFLERVRKSFPEREAPHFNLISQTIWTLLGKGFIYIDINQPAPQNWEWRLTTTGEDATNDDQYNPDFPDRYIEDLKNKIPKISETVLLYLKESLCCYHNDNYLASAVMLGVASEAAFLEMASESIPWFDSAGEKLQKLLDKPAEPFVNKFVEFRKRIEPRKNELPTEISDNMSLTFDSILDTLRIVRNESGHPTGKKVSRDDQYISFHMFGRYLTKMYILRDFFISKSK